MLFPILEQAVYNSDAHVIAQDDYSSVCRAESDGGSYVITGYQVFPGIRLVYHDVHLAQCCGEQFSGSLIEIAHCREGRIECDVGGEFHYLSPGDLSIRLLSGSSRTYYPLSHYHGVSILIDAEKAPECLSCFLDDVNVSPRMLIDKFDLSRQSFISRSDSSIEHIFSELYSVSESIRKGYFKVKILELMLFLNGLDLNNSNTQNRSFSYKQVELAKSVSAYLTQRMDTHITIEQLSAIFHVSQTLLKNSFKGVYGLSVYAYIRTQKMHSAAAMLRQSELSVLEIAGRCGYDNGSKFAKAFKEIMGMTPLEYRTKSRLTPDDIV